MKKIKFSLTIGVGLLILLISGCFNQGEEVGVVKNIEFWGTTINEQTANIEFDQPFSTSNTSYVASVGYEVEKINIIPEPGDGSEITREVRDEKLEVGENNRNHFKVIVTNQKSGLSRTYNFYVVREKPDSNSYLSKLNLSDINLNISEDDDKKEQTYIATVPYEIKATTVSAIVENENANINITDATVDPDEVKGAYDNTIEIKYKKELSVGENEIKLEVNAQDKSTRIYTIIITREKKENAESNADLKSLSIVDVTKDEVIPLEPTFVPEETVYKTEVTFEIDKIDIQGESYSSKSKILKGLGELMLTVGTNTKEIVVEAEDGTIKNYLLIITRRGSEDAGDNNYLNTLNIEGVDLEFNKTKSVYEKNVSNSTTSVSISVETDSSTAVAKIGDSSNNKLTISKNLTVGSNIISIDVIAENGNKRPYTLILTREESQTGGDNSELESLELTDVVLGGFSSKQHTYITSVPYEITSTTVTAIAKDEKATIDYGGSRKKKLTVGSNVIELKMEAENGKSSTYSVIITRESSGETESNADLKSITVKNGEDVLNLDPEFSPDKLLYTLNVSSEVKEINISVTSMVSDSDITGHTGIQSLDIGSNTFTLDVTSSNGTKKSYVVIVKRESSGDNYLNNLSVKNGDQELLGDFKPTKTSYTKEVSFDSTDVTLSVEKSSTKATITEDSNIGTNSLKVGDNLLRVTIQAEDGSLKVYTIVITRKALNSNSNLISLNVGDKILNPEFSKDTYSYVVGVGNSVNTIDISAEPESGKGEVSGTGEISLEEGINKQEIVVTAEDGTESIYTLVMNRDYKPSEARLDSITLSTGELYPEFSSDRQTYTAVVSNSVDSIEITTVKSDKTESVTGDGTINLDAGVNVIEILANAADGTKTNYVIVIERGKSSINELDSLSIKDEETELLNNFNPSINNYSFEVANSVTSVAINVSQKDDLSKILEDKSDIGKQNLYEGINNFSIFIQAENGEINEYKIEVTRMFQNNDATLKNITI